MIASVFDDKKVRVWDFNSGKRTLTLKGHTDNVSSVAFSFDSRKIISASYDGTIRIWNSATGKRIMTLKGHTGRVNSVSISSDGGKIVSASDDWTIRIWSSATGKCLQIIEEQSSVDSVAFCCLDSRIISTSWDKICIWDVSTGICLASLGDEELPIDVNSASFSYDGRMIVFTSDDEIIRIWDYLPLQNLINETRERFKKRHLTHEEMKKYYFE